MGAVVEEAAAAPGDVSASAVLRACDRDAKIGAVVGDADFDDTTLIMNVLLDIRSDTTRILELLQDDDDAEEEDS